MTEIKAACISEAAQKIAAAAGKQLSYTVVENEISTLAGKIVANCKLRVDA